MTDPVRNACSFLFVPATQPDRLPKALASGADMVIADWEDAVAPADKERARSALAEAVAALDGARRERLLVRINAEGTPWFAADLQALPQLMAQGLAGAVVPKAESAQTLQAVARAAGPQAALLALVESVAGLYAVDVLAAAPQVARLAFGHLDFQVDAGMACGPDEAELLPMRMAVVLAARRAGMAAPLDGVTVDTRNPERMASDAERARRMGFGGKLCIHPAQVPVLHAAFDPGEAAVAHARRVQQALQEAGGGVCVLDGRMVDAPVLAQARQTLERHAHAQRRSA
ncbi:CoA ester lyase [Alicycliphilus denitrificans]|jgi:citrate lyase subunit beta/citryl-CoA lyase|uniref:CoA ester lyase n=1 Tax=Alicycliphilus denitrificans TaxID=179636 RepID=A0A420KH17_9BURK|nr:CoA ester lyase [Alicycliphilus denitrificans]MBN9573269.1 CoA ester lyase [Alicycliphilus denitrificans]OJW93287.1 MAG: CoA ester lyase [Alicycliphilus sp. 69-12]RKJ99252.1 CoA ester lyase [Alicycliphilus denitrificans]BCN36857.1 CoA ester lyase [Alicycliphilus denitrificans]